MKEIWKPVVGWQGLYGVSNMGRVRSYQLKGPRGQRSIRSEPKLMRLAKRTGYPSVSLESSGVKVSCSVHRLVLEAFVGPCPKGMECAHNNGVRDDCRLSNLRWDTPSNNNADKNKHGTAYRGERVNTAVLNPKLVRWLRASGLGDTELANSLGVHRTTIWQARTARSWKHI
jgi:hypothetical protein